MYAHQPEAAERGVGGTMLVMSTSDMEIEHRRCEDAGLVQETEGRVGAVVIVGLSGGVGVRLGAV